MKTKTTRHRYHYWTLAAWLAAAAQGCVTSSGELGALGGEGSGGATEGDEGDAAISASESGGEGGSESGTSPDACELDVGTSTPRAMMRRQYENTIEDLLDLDRLAWSTDDAWTFISVRHAGPFETREWDAGELPAGFSALASTIAPLVDAEALLPCTLPAADAETCAESFVTSFGRSAWRRDLSSDEVAALMLHYSDGDLVAGTQDVVFDLLVSPNLWTIVPTGTPYVADPGITLLDSWSLASRLSYFVWNSTPDDQLLDHAASGDLVQHEVLMAEAERMLADPRAQRMLGDFYVPMMDIEGLRDVTKDPEAFPQFTPELAEAMIQEVRRFAADAVLGQGDGRLHTLLNAPFTFVNDELAGLYQDEVASTDGAPGPQTFVRATLDPARRGGLLSQPGFMTAHSFASSVGYSSRGLVLRESFLCQTIPAPPPDTSNIEFPDPPYDRYELWDQTMAAPACQGCHILIDPMGFAFDNYDALGQWQTEIAETPVDSTAEVVAADDLDGVYLGRAALGEAMAASTLVRECMVQQHLHFALRRSLGEDDQCTIDALTEALVSTDGDLEQLILDVVGSGAFGATRSE